MQIRLTQWENVLVAMTVDASRKNSKLGFSDHSGNHGCMAHVLKKLASLVGMVLLCNCEG
jgi:hypothetical protein